MKKKKFLPGAKLVATINGNELKVDNYTLRIRSVGCQEDYLENDAAGLREISISLGDKSACII